MEREHRNFCVVVEFLENDMIINRKYECAIKYLGLTVEIKEYLTKNEEKIKIIFNIMNKIRILSKTEILEKKEEIRIIDKTITVKNKKNNVIIMNAKELINMQPLKIIFKKEGKYIIFANLINENNMVINSYNTNTIIDVKYPINYLRIETNKEEISMKEIEKEKLYERLREIENYMEQDDDFLLKNEKKIYDYLN
jgi:hypothetical protein